MARSKKNNSLIDGLKVFANDFKNQYIGVKNLCIATITTGLVNISNVAYCSGSGGGDIDSIIKALAGIILKIFGYIGVLLIHWGIGQLVLAFKNEDADSKSRAIMLIVAAAVLLALKPLLSTIPGISQYL